MHPIEHDSENRKASPVRVSFRREEILGSANVPAHARREWLMTNGLGGFAMGTVDGRPDRRYHAWLVAASKPPVGRIVALHSCAEWLIVRTGQGATKSELRLDLSTYRFADGALSPRGTDALVSFTRSADGGCLWEYEHETKLARFRVTRRLTLASDRNAAQVQYEVHCNLARGAPSIHCSLEVRPFTPLRDFHKCEHRHDHIHAQTLEPGAAAPNAPAPECIVTRGNLRLVLRAGAGFAFSHDANWWNRFAYERDQFRGQNEPEDLFSPGTFTLAVKSTGPTTATITADFESAPATTHTASYSAKPISPGTLPALRAPGAAALLNAAAQFFAQRTKHGEPAPASSPASAIIAGYPWFGDWGRDTCISLPGLMLTTGRFEEARDTLVAMAALQRNGLIPNCFDDGSGHAEYNTADASLHFLRACCAFARVAPDRSHFTQRLLPACLEIIAAYRSGTDFSIRVDPADGLVCAGDASTQLTWMDARRDGVVFTPRHGKPVELSALWYSALLELAEVIEKSSARQATELRQHADVTARNFVSEFWNERAGCLYDVLTPAWGRFVPDAKIRPNQLFAISLPHSPLSPEQRTAAVACVEKHLVTPEGLRTLAPSDPDYRGRYEGSLFERDRAYHNGTVWPWLIGPYAEALLRVGNFSPDARARARAAIAPLLARFADPMKFPAEPILQLSEVYDGDDSPERPRRADGCPAQAWSVAELLRVLNLCESGESRSN